MKIVFSVSTIHELKEMGVGVGGGGWGPEKVGGLGYTEELNFDL